MSRACPFGEKAALLIGINQSFLHFFVLLRKHQVQEWEQAAESIPKTRVGVHKSGQYFPVIRAVVHDLSLGIHFVKFSWEKQRTIQA